MKETHEVSGNDVFELLQITAQKIDLAEIRNNQKHPDRRRFVNEFVELLENYMRANKIQKPDGYFIKLKEVASSLTNQLMNMIEALQQNNQETFVSFVRTFDQETLRRMGQLEKESHISRTDLPAGLRGFTAQDIGEILATRRDVRDIARESHRGFGMNPSSE